MKANATHTSLMLFILALTAPTFAQFDDDESVKTVESPQEKNVLAALELSKMAATANQPAISFEALRRIAFTGPVITKVDLGGLLSSPQQNNSINYSSNSNQPTPQQQAAKRVASKMIEVNDLWGKKEFDARQACQVWFEHVFPAEPAGAINMHTQTLSNIERNSYNSFTLTFSSNKTPQKCGAQCLIEWATKSNRIDEVEKELAKRIVQPGNADLGWLFKVWLAEAKKATGEAYEAILAEIEPKIATHIVGLHAELKTHAIRESLKKLPADSEFKSRFKKAFLQALPGTSNWNGNPDNMNLLREWIVEAIDTKDAHSADLIAEAVTSQWSSVRNGNESWVGNMESQAFIELSQTAFEKKAFQLGSAWMQRVSFGALEQQGEGWFQLRGTTSQHLLNCPQDVRYDILAKQVWTAPMLGLRNMSSLMPNFLTPAFFRSEAKSPLGQLASKNASSVSALEWLMRDAIALGKQVEIEQKFAAMQESKSDDLPLAKMIWSKANDQPLDLKSMIQETAGDGNSKPTLAIKRLVPADSPPIPIELEIAEIALRDSSTQELGIEFTKRLLDSCLKHNKSALMSQCRSLLHSASNVNGKSPITHTSLKHFVEASDWDGGAILDGIPSKPNWVSRNESSSSWGHETSIMQSYLFFKYPLTGDFEIAFKARDGSFAEPGIALGGILTEFLPYNKTISLSSFGYRHVGTTIKKFDKFKQGDWNQYRVKRNASEFQVFANEELAVTIPCEESAMPFIAFGAKSYRSTTIDELKISGRIQVPRKVSLCAPRLPGWSAYYTQQMLEPVQLMLKNTKIDNEDAADFADEDEQQGYDYDKIMEQPFPSWVGQENGDAAYPWVVKDGVLESVDQTLAKQAKLEELEANGTYIQPYVRERIEKEPTKPRSIGMIYYQRPLCDGETLELEFYQDSKPEPTEGKARTLPCSISPTIGRTAVLLDQPEIALRWIAGEGEKEWLGTDPEQRVVDPEARQLSKVQLRERDWNALSIRLLNGVATLFINGEAIYQRTWDSTTSPQFGLYHNPNTSQVRVRNIILAGNWPETLPETLFELLP